MMRTTTLTWQQAWWLCGILAVTVLVVRLAASQRGLRLGRRARFAVAAGTEIALLAGLDGLWILAGRPTAADPRGAFDRARTLVRIQHDLYLPHEQDLVNALAPHRLLAQFANLYYASMHFTVMGILLVWLFWRHRERYADIRTWMVLFTACALCVQLIPVAPPRLMPELGFVDVAKLYGQSVYGGVGNFQPAQFGAMPSVHVGWALLTAYAVCTISTSRWRWIALAHTTLMCLVVVATANHWWGDGIVAAGLLLIARAIQLSVRTLLRRLRAGRADGGAPPGDDLIGVSPSRAAPADGP
jgi:hypothetical protein